MATPSLSKHFSSQMPTPSPLLVICIILAIFTCSCNSQEEEHHSQQNITKLIVIDGFNIPRLASAGEQFSFAAASAASLGHQRALFKSVVQFFPEDRIVIGHAELEIAYLELGSDYRNSLPDQQMNAASNYLQIAVEYQDVPEIAAKALWYHGWISADLLKLKSIGMNSFLSIVNQYAEQPKSRSSFPPWTSINLEQEYDKVLNSQPQPSITWGVLALLELIRYAPNTELGLAHYHSLISYLPENTIVGAALTLLATRTDLSPVNRSAIKREIDNATITLTLQKQLNEFLLTTQQEVRQ